jgi:SSS family solute:Na+ symporter
MHAEPGAMRPLIWIIIVAYLTYVAVDGLRRARRSKGLEGYLLANRSLPWWAVGLSVMATQLSAITLIGTTGQGAVDGMRFVQFYLGLPLAMVILGVTLVPFLHGAKVYTAYEYLERRFDARTRSLTAFLFLMSRGLSVGTILATPGVVFSAMFGWPITWSVAVMGVPAVLYTIFGGVGAVAWADVKQMALVTFSLVAVIVVLIMRIPVGPDDALRLAGAVGRLQVFDFSFDVTRTYTFWSGLIGGCFLMLSYFGTDQSQVQRYLAAKSVDQARISLLVSAYWKIPLQALVLLVGVLVFVFYLFQAAPLYFNPTDARRAQQSDTALFAQLDAHYRVASADLHVAAARMAGARDMATRVSATSAFLASDSAVRIVRGAALALATKDPKAPARDVNYIIPHFVLTELPVWLAGLFMAAVLAAAMSAIAAELNSLATTTVIDFYRRWVRPESSDAHYLTVSKVATGFWGLFACVVATHAATLGSLIEVVNKFGSFFYGEILGVFLLAMVAGARAFGAFVGLLAGIAAVAAVSIYAPAVSFLWYNVVGAATVVAVGMLLSIVGRSRLNSRR